MSEHAVTSPTTSDEDWANEIKNLKMELTTYVGRCCDELTEDIGSTDSKVEAVKTGVRDVETKVTTLSETVVDSEDRIRDAIVDTKTELNNALMTESGELSELLNSCCTKLNDVSGDLGDLSSKVAETGQAIEAQLVELKEEVLALSGIVNSLQKSYFGMILEIENYAKLAVSEKTETLILADALVKTLGSCETLTSDIRTFKEEYLLNAKVSLEGNKWKWVAYLGGAIGAVLLGFTGVSLLSIYSKQQREESRWR